MQVIESLLQQHFAELDKIVYKVLAPTASSSFDEEFNAPPQKMEKYHEERYSDENEEDDPLQEYSDITLDHQVFNALNQVFDDGYMGNPKEALFARNFHMQRRCIKAIENKKEKLEDDELKYEEKCFEISLGEELNLFFTSDDLKSIKKGPIAYCIIQNYVNILQAAKVITENIYVFPQQFLQQLMGGDHFDKSKEGQEALKGIIGKNFETYHSEININLLDPDYLIIPIFLGECQKCMIVQLSNKTGKNNPKFNVILCNLTQEKGKMYVLAIRTILEMAVAKSNINKNINFHTIPFIVPRQPSQEDSSLYLLLCLEFLFAKKYTELHDLKSYQQRTKLHLFPRCLSLKSRQEIYNLFIQLAEEQSLLKRVLLCEEFICNRMKICNDAPLRLNYDEIDQREVKKYLILKHKTSSKGNTASGFQDIMDYYLDEDINYQRSFYQ